VVMNRYRCAAPEQRDSQSVRFRKSPTARCRTLPETGLRAADRGLWTADCSCQTTTPDWMRAPLGTMMMPLRM
jgi:hypothetical protein